MPESTTSFLFPDINVWIALTYDRHVHHVLAREWFRGTSSSTRLFFCRLTQLGFLRLLTTDAVMGPDQPMTQLAAWAAYDHWLADERVDFVEEPAGIETPFRSLTRSRRAAPKDWMDSYLAAFAEAAQFTIVTFDRGFRNRTKRLILLRS